MSETIPELRVEMEQTRDRMSRTAAELDAAVHQKIDAAKARVDHARQEVVGHLDVRRYAREHPWPALGVALGLGLLIGRSGADRKAARATVKGARAAPVVTAAAAKRGTHRAVQAVRDRYRQRKLEREIHDARLGGPRGKDAASGPGLTEKLAAGVARVTHADEMLEQMRVQADLVGHPSPEPTGTTGRPNDVVRERVVVSRPAVEPTGL